MTLYAQIKDEGKLEEKNEVILKGFENEISISLLANITQLDTTEVIQILKDNNLE
jgi:hypothetical protein